MPLPFRQETRATVRRRIGFLLYGRNRFAYGTVLASPAPSSTTFALALAKRYPDSAWVGRVVYSVSGTGIGQYAVVTGHAQSTGVLTVAPALSPTFDSTTVVELWDEFLTPDDVNEAIDRAILRVQDVVQVYSDAQPSALVTNSSGLVVGLTLPATYTKIASIRYLDTGNLWHEYFPAPWQDTRDNLSFYLTGPTAYITPAVSGTTYPISSWHCLGYKLPTLLTSDSTNAEVPSQYLVFYAAAMLDASEAGGQLTDPEQHAGRAANWLREAAAIESRMGTAWLPNTLEIPG